MRSPDTDPAQAAHPAQVAHSARSAVGEEGSVTEPTELRPPEPVGLLARDIDGARWIGWNAAASRLIAFGDDGVLQASADLDLAARPVFGLAVEGGQVYLAADALLRYDWTEGVLAEDFSPGYYNEEDEFVARHAPWYRSLRERARLTFLYTEVFLGGDQIRYVLDGSTGDDHSPPGYLDTVPEEDIDAVVRAQVEGTPFVSGIREWEIWGLVKVSAAPIRDVTGKVVALAGADVDIGVIRSKTRNALFAVLGVGGVLMLVSGLVSLSVAQTITRPLRDIKNAALRIAAGQYGQRLQNATADDIGRLAGSLDRLSLRLHEQEEASSASQAELLTGRLDEAVRASLLTDPSQPSRVRVLTASGWLVAEFAALHEGGATEHAIAAGRLQVLARRLAELGTLRADALFAATPQLRWLLIWDPASQQVQWESQKVALHARDAQGGEQTLAAGLHALDAEVRVLMVDGEVIVQRGTEA